MLVASPRRVLSTPLGATPLDELVPRVGDCTPVAFPLGVLPPEPEIPTLVGRSVLPGLNVRSVLSVSVVPGLRSPSRALPKSRLVCVILPVLVT